MPGSAPAAAQEWQEEGEEDQEIIAPGVVAETTFTLRLLVVILVLAVLMLVNLVVVTLPVVRRFIVSMWQGEGGEKHI